MQGDIQWLELAEQPGTTVFTIVTKDVTVAVACGAIAIGAWTDDVEGSPLGEVDTVAGEFIELISLAAFEEVGIAGAEMLGSIEPPTLEELAVAELLSVAAPPAIGELDVASLELVGPIEPPDFQGTGTIGVELPGTADPPAIRELCAEPEVPEPKISANWSGMAAPFNDWSWI